jgi:hypothetical protein
MIYSRSLSDFLLTGRSFLVRNGNPNSHFHFTTGHELGPTTNRNVAVEALSRFGLERSGGADIKIDVGATRENKRLEKLIPRHNNPEKRRLVARPGDWPWSRCGGRFCYLEDRSV